MSSLTTELPKRNPVQKPPSFQLGQRQWLTGLRGIAVSCVVLFHLQNIIYEGRPVLGYASLRQGYLGVDIFFVLSGFLITVLLIEEWTRNASINLVAFYLRRCLRLLPALCVLLLATIVFVAITAQDRLLVTVMIAASSMVYGTNWLIAFGFYGDDQLLSHTWSLAIEEQFYLAWPLSFIGLMKLGLRQETIISLIALVIVAILIHRIAMYNAGFSPVRIYNGTDTRADSLLIGCLAAMLVAWNKLTQDPWFQKAVTVAVTLSAIGIGMYLTGNNRGPVFSWGFTVFASGVAVILVYMIKQPFRLVCSALEYRPLVWLGEISYGLYLWHYLAIHIARRCFVSKELVTFGAVLLALILSSLSYTIIERPFLKLKKRYASHTSQIVEVK